MEWYWRFFRAAYRGGKDWYFPDIAGNPIATVTSSATQTTESLTHVGSMLNERCFLTRFPLEDYEDWLGRRARSYYENYCAHVINTYTSHLLAMPIKTDGAPPYTEWAKDPMGTGATHAMLRMRRRALTMAQEYGHCFACTDKTAAPEGEEIVSEYDERRLGIRPYTYLLSPLDVVDWQVDGKNALLWARVRQWIQADPSDPYADRSPREVFRVWTRTETWIEDGQDKLQHRTHGLGKVPLDVLYSETDPEGGFLGLSRIRDIAFVAREIFNLSSLQQQSLYFNTFPLGFVPDKGNRFGGKLKVGTQQLIPYDPEGGGAPVFVAPPIEGARFLGERMQELMDEIRMLSGLSRGKAEQSLQARSGNAILVETQDKGARLRDLATNAEEWEHALGDTVMRWSTGKPATEEHVKVVYPKHFNVSALADQLAEGLQLKQLGIPQTHPEAWREIEGDIIRRALDDRTKDEIDELLTPAEPEPMPSDDAAINARGAEEEGDEEKAEYIANTGRGIPDGETES